MRESHSALSVHEFARDDPDPVPADAALVARLQQAAKLANDNCDRAMALAHKLSAQLREAESRINQLELEGDGFVDRLQNELVQARDQVKIEADARIEQIKIEADERVARAEIEADARVERMKIEADDRVARAEAEAKKHLDRGRVEMEEHFSRLKVDLAQVETRADRAEKWLVLIRQEIEEHLMPSFVAMHDRSTPPEAD
jgi:hypothetical protein